MSAKSGAIVLALLAVPLFLLWGCGTSLEALRLDQSAKADLRREVGVYDSTGPDQHEAVKALKAISCQNTVGDPAPSRDDAVDQLRYKAQVLGANGITDLRCGPPQSDSLAKKCWSSVTCEATAIKVGPGAVKIITTPEEMQEEMRQKIEAMQEKEKIAYAECKRKASNFVESVNCSNAGMLKIHRDAGDPYMDLMQLFAAQRLVFAERLDKGTMTEAEAGAAIQELIVRISQERRERDAQQRADLRLQAMELDQQKNARMQTYGALFQDLETWQITGKPKSLLASPAPLSGSTASVKPSPAPAGPRSAGKVVQGSHKQGRAASAAHALKKDKVTKLKTRLVSGRRTDHPALRSNKGGAPSRAGLGRSEWRRGRKLPPKDQTGQGEPQ